MTDHNADGEIKGSGNHGEASSAPDSSDTVQHETKAVGAPDESASTHVAKQPSKEITLQRLTPHSSWEDYAFRDDTVHEQAANAAAAPEATASRRMSIAAIVTIAAAVGAIGATAGVGHYLKADQTAAVAASSAAAEQARTVDNAIAKINADIAALKSNGAAQSAKIAERIEKVEKAQAEPAAKLAKLSEAVDKLRAPATVTAATPAPEITGSIKSTAAAQPNRLPVVDGWVLREVFDGTATVVGRQGIFDVIPGDPLPGVGRVDAIRRQDGRWVVVTSRGLIVSR